MPIFQDDLGGGRSTPPRNYFTRTSLSNSPTTSNILTRKASEESIRTELCEGPIPDNPDDFLQNPTLDFSPEVDSTMLPTSDHAEFIERLKKGETPTWVPKRDVRLPVAV